MSGMTAELYDALVIGGGPVGSRVAFKLASAGLRVAVLEKKATTGNRICCTGIIGQECIDTFGIDDSLVLNRGNAAVFFSAAGNRVEVFRRQTQAYILDRAGFDSFMAKRAAGQGAEYFFSNHADEVVMHADRVTAVARSLDGRRQFDARVMVIAAGFGANLSEMAGLSGIKDFAMGVQAEAETSGVDRVEIYFGSKIAPGFFAWVLPTTAGKARVGLISRRDTAGYLRKFLSFLTAQGKITSCGDFSYGGVPLKTPERSYAQRILVAGDAAGQVKPTTGGGIYYGLLSADIAAGVLLSAMEKGDFSAKQMALYQRQWMRKLGRELAIGYYARRVFEGLRDERLDRLFEVINRNGINTLVSESSRLSFDWHSKSIVTMLRSLGFRVAPLTVQLLKSRLFHEH